MLLLGLDLGTTGCKAAVFDPEGRLRGRASREYEVLCGEGSKAEQDAERVWSLAREAIREAAAEAGAGEIGALGASVQGDAVIPVDRDFRALGPAILGMDYRSAPQAARCAEIFGDFALFRRTGMRPHPLNALTKVLLLRDLAPRTYDSAWKVVTYADFVLGKLGGEALMDWTMASRTMAFDLETRTWSGEILGRLGLDASKFSPTAASGVPAGTIRPRAAESLGLSRRVLLATGGHDQTCAAIGAGAVREGPGVVSTGTAEVLSAALDRPRLARAMFDGFYPCYLHAKPDAYFTFALNHSGGILLKWWRDEFARAEVEAARSRGIDPYREIDARMPDGPSPVTVVPHFTGSGTPACDLEAKGAIVGLTLAVTRHDVAKAILEGLCFELRVNLDTLSEIGIRVDELAAVGGGARSERWLQLKADVLGRPIRTLRSPDAAPLGAALLAGTAAGIYRSVDEAVASAVSFDREFSPRPEAAARYSEKFAAYLRVSSALKPINPLLRRHEPPHGSA